MTRGKHDQRGRKVKANFQRTVLSPRGEDRSRRLHLGVIRPAGANFGGDLDGPRSQLTVERGHRIEKRRLIDRNGSCIQTGNRYDTLVGSAELSGRVQGQLQGGVQ